MRHFLPTVLSDAWVSPTLSSPAGSMWRRAVVSARHNGLVLGAPAPASGRRLSNATRETAPIVRLLLALAETLTAAAPSTTIDQRRHALVAGLSAVYGDQDLHQLLWQESDDHRRLLRVEQALRARSYLVGNPLLGLLIHFAFTAVDAGAVLRVAIAVLQSPNASIDVAKSQAVAHQQRRVSLQAVAAVRHAHDGPLEDGVVADTVRWQLRHLGFSRQLTADLEAAAFGTDGTIAVEGFPFGDGGQHLYRHSVLLAHVTGRPSRDDHRHLHRLAQACEVLPVVAGRVHHDVLQTLAERPNDFDVVSLAAEFETAHRPLMGRILDALRDNMDALVREVRETGDLAVLLTRRTRGQTLTAAEQARMREQLADVAKAVPALALLTLPGGFVLLPLLLRVLPFDLRPRAFSDLDEFHTFAKDDQDALPKPDPDDVAHATGRSHRLWRRK